MYPYQKFLHEKKTRRRGLPALLFYCGVYLACNLVFLAVFGPHFGYAVTVRSDLNYPVAITPVDVEDGQIRGATPVILHCPLFLHSRRNVNILLRPYGEVELYFDAIEHGPESILFRRLEQDGDLHEKRVSTIKQSLSRNQNVVIEKADTAVGAVAMRDDIARHDTGDGGLGWVALLELLGLWIPVCLPAMIGFVIVMTVKFKFDKP